MPRHRIKDWSENFENNRSRELKRADWVAMPNKMDGLGYVQLVTSEDGAALFGAWCAMVEIASRQTPRGSLPTKNGSTAAALALISRLPEFIFERTLARVMEIGWVEELGAAIPQEGAAIPQEGAAIPQEGAAIPQEGAAHARAAALPFRSLPFRSIPFPEESARETKPDDSWERFSEIATQVGMAASDEERDGLARDVWPALSFEDRLGAARTALRRRESGEYEGQFVPLMANYLRKRLWTRADRPRSPPRQDMRDRQDEIFRSRLTRKLAAKGLLNAG